MRVFLASLLPAEVGERLRTRGEARRTWLLVSLLLLSVIGVSVHSWDQARRARAIRAASISLRETAIDVDTELSRLEAERRELNDFMTTHRRVALPIEVSDLLATITNAMPAKATLTDLSIKLVSRDGAVRGALAAPPPPAAPGAPPAPPAPPPRRVLELRVRGFALSINEVSAFERTLASLPPLSAVALAENRSLDTPDGSFQEFVITAEVDLDRNYAGARGRGPVALSSVAGSGAAAREASP